MAAPYTYEPLPGEGWMRLLKLERPDDHDQIHVTLTNYRIDDEIEYSALSYTWGPPKASEYDDELNQKRYYEQSTQILVNEQPLLVGLNLYEFFLRLRDSTIDVLLWIDAICINQGDDFERSSQVNAMSEIFGNCSELIIWLGEEDAETKETAELIHTITLAASQRDPRGRSINLRSLGFWGFDNPEALRSIGLPPITRDQWWGLVHFYNRRWFGRLWIVQEFALPRERRLEGMAPTLTSLNRERVANQWDLWGSSLVQTSRKRPMFRVFCGSVVIPNKELQVCPYFLELTGIQEALVSLSPGEVKNFLAMSLSALISMRNLCHKGSYNEQKIAAQGFGLTKDDFNPYALFCLLHLRFWGRDCSDPRDRVFALIGILNQTLAAMSSSEVHIIAADYSKSVGDVYCDTSRAVLQGMQRLDFLLTMPDPADRIYQDLPSWVQDYSVRGVVPLTIWGERGHGVSCLNATKGFETTCLSFRSNDRVLNVIGLRLGSISDTSEDMALWNNLDAYESWAMLAIKCGETYVNGQSRLEALWRTIITDQTDHIHPAPATVGILFFQYLRSLFRFLDVLLLSNAQSVQGTVDLTAQLRPAPSIDKLAKSDPTGRMPMRHGDIKSILEGLQGNLHRDEFIRSEKTAAMKMVDDFWPYMRRAFGKRPFRTVDSLLGMGPKSTSEGDEAWLLQGARVPLVLRHNPETGRYRLIGQSYVHGMMQGEGIKGRETQWVDVEIE
ncbi:MAG: hypothetical protein Q9219_005100 [cf. Caloplaca sp. 3 TL-2023]